MFSAQRVMYSKRGMSATIITVLIIVLSLASVTILYTAVRPTLDTLENGDSTPSCLEFLFEISSCEYNSTLTSVHIRRGTGSGSIDSIQVLFDTPTGQELRTITSPLLDELETYIYFWSDIHTPREADIAVLLGDTFCPLTGSPRTCVETSTLEIMPLCHDGIDNDNDGWRDWPEDPGCDDVQDNDESNGDLGVCANNQDDELDGFIDGEDPLCLTWQSETETALCQNGADNDNDLWIDLLDYGCVDPNDNEEYNDPLQSPECSDLRDNDGDLFIDFADRECLSGTQVNESGIGPQLYACSDGLDNDNDTLIDYPADLGCETSLDNNESSDLLSCPYGNNLTNYATCDYRLALQNAYSELPVETYGISRRAWVIGAFALKAGNNETLGEMLSYSEAQIRTTFRNYLNNRPEINRDDLFIIDIEDELDPELIGNYSDDPNLQNQVIDALKVRVHVARTELPNAKLALWNTVLPDPAGRQRQTFVERMDGYYLAGQRGLYDELDYMLPNVYTRYGINDSVSNFNALNNMTRMALEYSQNLTRSDNRTTLTVMPVLSFLVANGGSVNHHEPVNRTMARQQIEFIQSYPSVEAILWWAGSDHYSPGGYDVDIVNYYGEVKPVPAECFCE